MCPDVVTQWLNYWRWDQSGERAAPFEAQLGIGDRRNCGDWSNLEMDDDRRLIPAGCGDEGYIAIVSAPAFIRGGERARMNHQEGCLLGRRGNWKEVRAAERDWVGKGTTTRRGDGRKGMTSRAGRPAPGGRAGRRSDFDVDAVRGVVVGRGGEGSRPPSLRI
eukprot:gene14637-biopygen2357